MRCKQTARRDVPSRFPRLRFNVPYRSFQHISVAVAADAAMSSTEPRTPPHASVAAPTTSLPTSLRPQRSCKHRVTSYANPGSSSDEYTLDDASASDDAVDRTRSHVYTPSPRKKRRRKSAGDNDAAKDAAATCDMHREFAQLPLPDEIFLHMILRYLDVISLVRFSALAHAGHRLAAFEMARRCGLTPADAAVMNSITSIMFRPFRLRRRRVAIRVAKNAPPNLIDKELTPLREQFRDRFEAMCRVCWKSQAYHSRNSAAYALHQRPICNNCLYLDDYKLITLSLAASCYGLQGLLLLGIKYVGSGSRKQYLARDLMLRARQVYRSWSLDAVSEAGTSEYYSRERSDGIRSHFSVHSHQAMVAAYLADELAWQQRVLNEFYALFVQTEAPELLGTCIFVALGELDCSPNQVPLSEPRPEEIAELWAALRNALVSSMRFDTNRYLYESAPIGPVSKRRSVLFIEQRRTAPEMVAFAVNALLVDFGEESPGWLTSIRMAVEKDLCNCTNSPWTQERLKEAYRVDKVFRHVTLREYGAATRFPTFHSNGWCRSRRWIQERLKEALWAWNVNH